MPAKNFLTAEQKKALQTAIRENSCPRLREHALILLLQNDGKTYEEIAKFLGCSYRTVAYWCVHGDPDNIESLRDRRERGNYRKADENYIQTLLELVNTPPESLGYDCQHWTSQRLASHLSKKTGIELSGTQILRILRKHKIRLPMSRV
ncbi:helix-turn-helix domain-containing protein [Oxynema aestuarii]|uniref:Helix-turn-helix domain-containing protein n=1 Tax=Oxynema aestuarii AP17 TaxID=2064643 RepID=A0A6H1TW04_9CYAN|nr:helix-turn-helix domain-containing protein [Oxynema aestuarii]QIZ70120.1 helix-turn-helix domain-containing protein [Oxynema aestuarii AP17]